MTIFNLSKYFLSMTRPARGALKYVECTNEKCQQDLLASTILHHLAALYPPSQAYVKAFLKALINVLEKNQVEISDDIYNIYTSLIMKSDTAKEFCYSTYLLDETTAVVLRTSQSLISKSTTGLHLWEASKFLAEWCMENVDQLKERSIIELGCGIGLSGLVVCKMCAPKSYIFTDSHKDVLNNLRHNIDVNIRDVNVDISVMNLNWEDAEQADIRSDIILAADVVYDIRLIQPLVKTLCKLLSASRMTTAYVTCTERNPLTMKTFLKEIESAGLNYELQQLRNKDVFIYTDEFIFLYKIYNKN